MKKEDILPYKEDIIRDLGMLVSYPSVYAEDAPPFGQANIDCLNAALKLAEGYGFKTVNLDNYCGYVEMGQGDEIVGILAHLDVVPVSENWTSDPFVLRQEGDMLYGRGTSDDKGAGVCALTALRMLKDREPQFRKRVRLIWGCNEESGSRGVEHYVEQEGYVDCGFTPDGEFPLVFGEKGMVFATLRAPSEKILAIEASSAHNIVPAKCTVTLKPNCYDPRRLADYLNEHEISFELKDDVLTVNGAAAHASLPEKGVNALSYAMEALHYAGIDDEFVNVYHDLVGLDYNGKNASVGFEDEYGKLTMNLGVAEKKDGDVCASIDIRFPVTMKKEDIIRPLEEAGQGYIIETEGVDPLFFPLDHPMIKALMKAYVDVTGDTESQPMAIGGGTYAKDMHGIVAFGCDDGKHNYRIHDDDEFVTVDSLLMQTACYYQAILNLLEI
ncbi:MAG: Sapep family Mn(2+)-dependent dipeptidase [Erysipelotrichaceae bacterium]|nr:Sapep family Mn(2+)-dependent dipeptidase [Erysipelotrichaceae bacterium]